MQREGNLFRIARTPCDDPFQLQCVVLDRHDLDQFCLDHLFVSSHKLRLTVFILLRASQRPGPLGSLLDRPEHRNTVGRTYDYSPIRNGWNDVLVAHAE